MVVLGFCIIFSKIIKGYSKKAEPLYLLTQKKCQFFVGWVMRGHILTAQALHYDSAHARDILSLPWHAAQSTHGF